MTTVVYTLHINKQIFFKYLLIGCPLFLPNHSQNMGTKVFFVISHILDLFLPTSTQLFITPLGSGAKK